MEDMIKKGLLLGAGFGILAEEKIDDYLAKLQDWDMLDEKEAKKLAKDLMAKREKEVKRQMKAIDKQINDTLKKAGLVKKREYEKLEKKVEKLKEKLDAMAGKKAKPVKKQKKSAKKKAPVKKKPVKTGRKTKKKSRK